MYFNWKMRPPLRTSTTTTQGSNMLTRERMRLRRRLLVLAVLTIQTQIKSTSCSSEGSSWQDPSRSRGRPDAPKYYPYQGGDPMSTGDVDDDDDEVDRRGYDGAYQTDRRHRRRYEDGYYDASTSSGRGDAQEHQQQPSSRQTPPLPPPPPRPLPDESESSSYTPIHYQFRAADKKSTASRDDPRRSRNYPSEDHDDVPHTELLHRSQQQQAAIGDEKDNGRTYASPRDDIVTRYMANKRGRIMLTCSSGMVGMSLGSFVGKSLMNNPRPVGLVLLFLFVICTLLRNPYGELSRALGMALILALQRTQYIRRKYPAWPHIKACLGVGPRLPTEDEDNDYNALYAVIAMAFVGFACGGSLPLPLLPTWMGAMMGGAVLAFSTTLPTSNGDLARTMGMRVVSLCEEVVYINSDLKIMSKVGIVSGKLLDKVLVMDRKHRIKDRLIAAFSWAYEQISRTAEQVQTDRTTSMRDGEELSPPPREPQDGRRK